MVDSFYSQSDAGEHHPDYIPKDFSRKRQEEQ